MSAQGAEKKSKKTGGGGGARQARKLRYGRCHRRGAAPRAAQLPAPPSNRRLRPSYAVGFQSRGAPGAVSGHQETAYTPRSLPAADPAVQIWTPAPNRKKPPGAFL